MAMLLSVMKNGGRRGKMHRWLMEFTVVAIAYSMMVKVRGEAVVNETTNITESYPYPKVIGGALGHSYIEHIDYNAITDAIVAGGYTYD
jgi:hypothetical protein